MLVSQESLPQQRCTDKNVIAVIISGEKGGNSILATQAVTHI